MFTQQIDELKGGGYYVKKNDRIQRPEWFDKHPGSEYQRIVTHVWRSVESGKYYAANSFKPEVQSFDNAKDAQAAYQGYIVNHALADTPRLPDAVQVSHGAIFVGQTITVDAYGQSYQAPLDFYPRQPFERGSGPRWLPLPKWRFGLSLNLVWVDQFTTPTEAESRDAFTGPSVTFQGGKIIGGQYSIGTSRNTVGFGLTTPRVGLVVAPYGYQAPSERFRFAWR